MIDCAVVGDSIALGVGLALQRCVTDAMVGLASADVVGRVQHASVLVVSAGSNDPHNPELEKNLRSIRAKATGQVIWIAPADPKAAAIVLRVARMHGDKVVHFTPREDHIHPASYGALAGRVQAVLRQAGV